MEAQYPTYGKPAPNAGIMMSHGYPTFYWWDGQKQRYKLVHIWVWEQCRGLVPEGYVVHHINGDKADYRIENLALKTRKEHQEHHLGFPAIDGKKMCTKCGNVLPVSEFVSNGKGGKRTDCKKCQKVVRQEWSEDHPGYFKEKANEWNKNNKDRRNARRRAYRQTNSKVENQKQREWRAKNLEDQQRKRKERDARKKEEKRRMEQEALGNQEVKGEGHEG